MSQWAVELMGKDIDLEHLCSNLSSETLSITREAGRYVLRSPRFDSLAEDSEVYRNAVELVDHMNGVAKILWPGLRAVRVERIIRVDDHGKRRSSFFESRTVTIPPRVSGRDTLMRSDGSVDRAAQSSEVDAWLQIAAQDPVAADVLAIFGSLDSSSENPWYGLYKVYEAIEKSLGGEKNTLKCFPAMEDKIKEFKETANRLHRHYPKKYEGRWKPMSLKTAKPLIGNLLREWLVERANDQ